MVTALERMTYIRQLHKEVLDCIYIKQKKVFQEEITRLVVINRNLLGCETYSFRFNYEWYTIGHEVPWQDAKKYNREIHPSLMEEINNLFQTKTFTERTIESDISNLIGNILKESQNTIDLSKLLPVGFFNSLDNEIFDIGNPLPDKR
ncbi:unnamed protein product, partial [marine sediment metagenome]